jgi:hypothetical protein
MRERCESSQGSRKTVLGRRTRGVHTFVRSLYSFHIGHACVWYGAANVCVLNQLATVQHIKALRQALGVMKSTTNMITYAESGEKPLPLRREFLAKKILFKWQCTGEKNVACKATNLAVIALTSKYGNAKQLPPLVKVYMHDLPAPVVPFFRI